MNAVEYFKSYGLSGAKRILRDARGCASVRLYDKYNFSTNDLKQIVDAWELVERFGDLRQAKLNLEHMISHNQFEFCATNIDELQNAINLAEQCQ